MDNSVHQLVANLSQWADPEWPLHPSTYTVWKLQAFSTSVSLVPLQGLPEILYLPLELLNSFIRYCIPHSFYLLYMLIY